MYCRVHFKFYRGSHVVYTISFACMEEGRDIAQTKWDMCLDKIIKYIASGERAEIWKEIVKTLLNMFTRYSVGVLLHYAKERCKTDSGAITSELFIF